MTCSSLLTVCAAGFGGTGSPNGGGCTQCPAGRFKGYAGDTPCTDCPAGQISIAYGATARTACPEDTFKAGKSSCSTCEVPSGTTNGLTGQSACGKKSA